MTYITKFLLPLFRGIKIIALDEICGDDAILLACTFLCIMKKGQNIRQKLFLAAIMVFCHFFFCTEPAEFDSIL